MHALCLALVPGLLFPPPPGPDTVEPNVLHPQHGPLASFGAATTSDAIWILGGHVGGAHEHSRENLSAKLVRYPLDDPRAFEERPGGVGLQSVALVAHGDALYRVGGMRATNAPDEPEDLHSVDVFARYLAGTGEWEPVAPLPEPRSSHDAIFLGDTLYVFGGWRLDGGTQSWHDAGLAFDLAADEPRWRSIGQPFLRRALATASAHGKVYVLGGLTPEGEASSSVDAYDPRSGEWERAADLPVTGFGATAFGTDEGLFFAGRDGNLWRLDDGAAAWERVRALAFPRFFARLVPAGPSRLAVLGGASPQGRPALLEIVPTAPDDGRSAISVLSLPFPGRTNQRQAAFLHNDRLFLFGGNLDAGQHRFAAEDFSDEGWSLDLLTGEWRSEAPFPAPRQSMRSAVLDGSSPAAIVAGGFGPGADGEARSWSEAWTFDLTSRTWHPAEVELPLALTQFGWVAAEDALWTAGGIAYPSASEGDFSRGDALFRWDLGSEKGFVEAAASLRSRRRAFGSAAIGRDIYLVGGMTDDFEPVVEPERVDLATGAGAPIAAPAAHRLGPSVAALGGRLYMTGGTSLGESGRAFDASLEAYDPAEDRWTTLASSLPVTAEHLRVLAWGERLIAFSTAREGRIDVALVTPPGARPEDGGFRHP